GVDGVDGVDGLRESGMDNRIRVLLLLTLVGGFADAGAFVLLGTFTGHITGNAVLAMIYLAQGRWLTLGYCAVALVCFLLGTYWGSRWRLRRMTDSDTRRIAPLLSLQLLLMLSGVGLWRWGCPSGFILLQALALGLQNGVIQSLHTTKVHSTYITGMSTSLINSLAAGRTAPDRPARATLLCGILGFVGGALLGGTLTDRFGAVGFIAVCIPLLAATLLSRRLGGASGG
ncbi:MAG: YoaK family protein, partial [Edwardsiella sp. (in: enterobacteria)]